MKKPNLFVLGAPKCGTTTLAYWLSQHPEVYVSPTKEPNYFFSPYGRSLALSEYEALFRNATKQPVVAEASVWYLYSGLAVERILEYNSDSKFIVCLRNPMEMAPSLHAQRCFSGYELESNFNRAWLLNAVRENGEFTLVQGIDRAFGDASHMSYRKVCLLGEQVEQLLGKIARKNVFFLFLDDMKSDPVSLWRDIQEFLEIEYFNDIDMSAKNPASIRRSRTFHKILLKAKRFKESLGIKKSIGLLRLLKKINTNSVNGYQISQRTYREMHLCFSDDVNKLFELTGRVPDWADFGNSIELKK